MLKLSAHLLVLMILLAGPVLACGFFDDAKDVVETVDAAVSLLQEIEKSGTWEYISDGLQGLEDQDQGYTAVVHLRDGNVNSDHQFESPLKMDVVIEVQVDADGDMLLLVDEAGTKRQYFIEHSADSSTPTRVYRIEDGRYVCVKSDEEGSTFDSGLDGIFEQYAGLAVGAQFLSVAKETGADKVAGREVTEYELESKVPEALKILEKIDSAELKQKIDESGEFALSGGLSLDKKTGALMQFISTYDDLDDQRRTELSFEITQWGSVPDIPAPTADQITTVCE
ncbi:MAG: hypothetical protein HY866_09120 [Chloroflexi bacterium]|nr:hypothetical protein [Chloroflexota bacterium]